MKFGATNSDYNAIRSVAWSCSDITQTLKKIWLLRQLCKFNKLGLSQILTMKFLNNTTNRLKFKVKNV